MQLLVLKLNLNRTQKHLAEKQDSTSQHQHPKHTSGKDDADVGNQSVLIDLDMAIKVDCESDLSGHQYCMGTRAYQSIAVLSSTTWANLLSKAPPQDHLDDLESFFYVLAWICIKYNGPENPIVVPNLELWEHHAAEISAMAKNQNLNTPLTILQPYFKNDEIFRNLIKALAQLC
ncbi:hypothetical protein CVT25_007483 [Psilocybe cyanescens]|uniref:Fungal-type protein kinase domain-containing protein n=1 Tax=Psilocybe cyanescens TaxID=93625 RepID=A0A409XVR9_PSICY|nr:hypothetical protein CVT25_007483 [Psilocybe cyanescens]